MLFKILNTRERVQEILIKYSSLENDKLFLEFTCNKTVGNFTFITFDKRFELPLMEINCELMQIPDTNSDADLSINSGVFALLINQLKQFGETIEIQCNEDKITLASISQESGKMTVDIGIDDITAFSITEGENMKLSFALSMLHNICMYNKISKEVDIFLTANFPMKLVYNLVDDASYTFYLAPKIGDDE